MSYIITSESFSANPNGLADPVSMWDRGRDSDGARSCGATVFCCTIRGRHHAHVVVTLIDNDDLSSPQSEDAIQVQDSSPLAIGASYAVRAGPPVAPRIEGSIGDRASVAP